MKEQTTYGTITTLAQCNQVADEIIHIWKRAGLNTIAQHKVGEKLKRWFDKYQALRKIPTERKVCGKGALQIEEFKTNINNCFTILSGDVPVEEQEFYEDQINERRMMVASAVDVNTTLCNKKAFMRKEKSLKRKQQQQLRCNEAASTSSFVDDAKKYLLSPI